MAKGFRYGCLMLLVAAGAAWAGDRYDIRESREIRESYDLGRDAGRTTVVVDNVFGSIEIVGHRSDTVDLEVKETILAEDRDALRDARDEVRLDIEREGDDLVFFVEGPFRDNRNGRWRDPGYRVQHDFVLHVPEEVALQIGTVNDGDIVVRDVRGAFDVHNVNGKITLSGLASAGRAVTVNGPVRAQWDRNPQDDSRFKTVNGAIELDFQPGLSADFTLETFNGDAATDFRYEMLPTQAEQEIGRDGMRRLRVRGGARIRVGRGGPEIDVETLNGDIELSRNGG